MDESMHREVEQPFPRCTVRPGTWGGSFAPPFTLSTGQLPSFLHSGPCEFQSLLLKELFLFYVSFFFLCSYLFILALLGLNSFKGPNVIRDYSKVSGLGCC